MGISDIFRKGRNAAHGQLRSHAMFISMITDDGAPLPEIKEVLINKAPAKRLVLVSASRLRWLILQAIEQKEQLSRFPVSKAICGPPVTPLSQLTESTPLHINSKLP
jgi:hypothetical protein